MGWGQGGRSSKPPWGHNTVTLFVKNAVSAHKTASTSTSWPVDHACHQQGRCLNCYIAPAMGREGNRWPERELKFTVSVNLWSNTGLFLLRKKQLYLEKQLLLPWTQTFKLNNPEMERFFKIQKVGSNWPLPHSVLRECANIHHHRYGNMWKHLRKPNTMQYKNYKSKHRKLQVSNAWAWIVLSKHNKE